MSFTNSTTNYHLPQYINTDIPSYLVDQNQAWATVDTNLKSVSNVADGAATTAGNAQSAASSAQSTANSASTKADGALSNEADAYSTTDTYAVGDYVIYNSILYKCVTAVTVPEAFDSDKWTRTTLEAIIDDVSNDVAGLDAAIGNTDISGIGDGTCTGAISNVNSGLNTTNSTVGSLNTDLTNFHNIVLKNIGTQNRSSILLTVATGTSAIFTGTITDEGDNSYGVMIVSNNGNGFGSITHFTNTHIYLHKYNGGVWSTSTL